MPLAAIWSARGGWTSGFAGSVAQINVGSCLPSQVLDGRSALGGSENVVVRAVANLDAGAVTTLRFDAYATTDRIATYNMAIYLTDGPDGPLLTKTAGWWPNGGSWGFTVAGNFFYAPGGYDQPVKMGVVVDGPAGEVWGTYDFGTGVQQTPHFAVAADYISALDTVRVYIDHRGALGMEVDNLVLVVPEPSTGELLALGLACAACWRLRSTRGLTASPHSRR